MSVLIKGMKMPKKCDECHFYKNLVNDTILAIIISILAILVNILAKI